MRRSHTSRQKPFHAPDALRRLAHTAEELSVLCHIGDGEKRQIAEAVAILKTPQCTAKRNKYKLFLYKVLKRYGPHLVLLCAVALGQAAVANMRINCRKRLEDLIAAEPFVGSSVLRSLAIGHGIPETVNELHSDDAPTRSSNTRFTSSGNFETVGTNSRSEQPSVDVCMDSNNPQKKAISTTTQEQEVIGPALPEGIPRVFDEFLGKAIRRVSAQSSNITMMKAAVTMVFPQSGLVDCLMSLDVCEKDVEQLAFALFNAKVKWVDQVLHIVVKEGITLIIPNSEATLKGVVDEAIVKVFGGDIYEAIRTSRVRRRELEQGKHLTECVSMILTKNGAFINLSLGMEGAVQIQNKLYTE